LAFIPFFTGPALGQISDPVQFVLAFNRDISAQLGSATIDGDERKRRFAALIDRGLDFDAIGKNLLGWRWTQAAMAARQAFDQEFRTYLIQTFATKVTGLDDGPMTATGVAQDDGAVLVLTEVATHEAAPDSFAWRVVHTAVGWRISDVIVDNVSMIAIMRSQFDALLQDGEPGFRSLLHVLHDRSGE
jgi:ABC-type transporter MlaC component